MMNKKAIFSFNVLHFILRILFLIVVLLSIIFLIRIYIISEVYIFDAESQIFIQRVLYSSDSISYFDDEIDRLYPMIIDLEGFNSDTIDSSFKKAIYYGDENKQIAAKITLIDDLGNDINSLFYNKEWFDKWSPLARTRYPGPGGARNKIEKRYILIKDKDKLKNGFLKIEVVIPNS